MFAGPSFTSLEPVIPPVGDRVHRRVPSTHVLFSHDAIKRGGEIIVVERREPAGVLGEHTRLSKTPAVLHGHVPDRTNAVVVSIRSAEASAARVATP
jgi:hypothetical protein